jgi:hypothetical protein
MYQTDEKYWHDYILICLFDSLFAKHGLVLSGSFQNKHAAAENTKINTCLF